MNLSLEVKNFLITMSAIPGERDSLHAEYRDDSRELVLTYQMPDERVEIQTDQGTVSLQIRQFELHFSDDVARHLSEPLPPEVLQ